MKTNIRCGGVFSFLIFFSLVQTVFADDAYQWLEEGQKAETLAWVEKHNKKTLDLLESHPAFQGVKSEIQEILNAPDKAPAIGIRGKYAYSILQDKDSPRGLWRRTPWEEVWKESPHWETVLDLGQLSRDENEDWVWSGVKCLPPAYERCLISFSRGGADKTVVREFNTVSKSFVQGGFELPEGHSELNWVDENRVFLNNYWDDTPDSISINHWTTKLWTRGTPITEATTIYQLQDPAEIQVQAYTIVRPEKTYLILNRRMKFFTNKHWILEPNASGGFDLEPIRFPKSAKFQGVFNGLGIALLQNPMEIRGRTFPTGSVVVLPLGRPKADLEVVYAPPEGVSVQSIALGKDSLLLSVLDHVKGRLIWLNRVQEGVWSEKALNYPDQGMAYLSSYELFSDRWIMQYENFVTPRSLYYQGEGQTFSEARLLKRQPHQYDSSGVQVEQIWASSKDGIQVPYFIIKKSNLPLNGSIPTVLYGYGGFGNSETPYYLGTWGKVWIEKGGAIVLANIRGGGEFGPRWHEAAIRERRQKSYDDFIAVAKNLIQNKITSPQKLGIEGGSNGGLLVGAVYVQRPDLFKAVVCEVPLLDMMRFQKMGGGSWISEYGDPENPQTAKTILKYSPYQNLQPGRSYPDVFFTTSTKDDRVDPGHARKMAAKMEEFGYPFEYYENPRGGHTGNSDLVDTIHSEALKFTFLTRELFDK